MLAAPREAACKGHVHALEHRAFAPSRPLEFAVMLAKLLMSAGKPECAENAVHVVRIPAAVAHAHADATARRFGAHAKVRVNERQARCRRGIHAEEVHSGKSQGAGR